MLGWRRRAWRRRQTMGYAVDRRIAMVRSMIHVVRRWRLRAVRRRRGWVRARLGGCGWGALLMARVVRVGPVHGRGRGMTRAVVLGVWRVFLTFARVVRVVRRVAEGRQAGLVWSGSRGPIGLLDGRQRRAGGGVGRRRTSVLVRRRCLRREGGVRRLLGVLWVLGVLWCRRRGRTRGVYGRRRRSCILGRSPVHDCAGLAAMRSRRSRHRHRQARRLCGRSGSGQWDLVRRGTWQPECAKPRRAVSNAKPGWPWANGRTWSVASGA